MGKFKGHNTQLESFYFNLSKRSYHDSFYCLPNSRGIPRYLDGKAPFENPKILKMFLWVAGGVLTKKTWELFGLTTKPEAFAKRSRLFLKLCASWTEGCPISILSSTNCWCVWGVIPSWTFNPLISPQSAWATMRRLKPSAMRIKTKGERGSPCLIPREGWKVLVGDPLRRILKKGVVTKPMTHSTHPWQKP